MTPEGLAEQRTVAGAGRVGATVSPGSVADITVPILVSPLLLFPHGFLPLLGLATILGLWLARWVIRRTHFRTNPLGLPMLLFLVMAAQALHPSIDLSLSMPKLYGILLGVAVYYGVATGVVTRRLWWIAVGAVTLSTVAVAAVGLVATAWLTNKLPDGPAIYGRIPHLISSVPTSLGTMAGIQPNELGGTLAFLLPLSFALLLWSLFPPRPLTHSPRLPIAVAALLALLIAGPVLVLTASRSAAMGMFAAGALMLGLRWKRVGLLLAAVVVVIAVAAMGPQHVYHLVARADQVSTPVGSTLATREEVWDRALSMIHDFPLTGIGLNTFQVVLNRSYPSILQGRGARIPHAHDIYLQTAVDLGIAGLMAFVGLWLIVGWQAVKAYRRATDPLMKGAVAGLAAGCAAYLVYGLTDAITLGAKPLVLLWVVVGLIVAARRLGLDGETERVGDGGSEGVGELRTQNPEPRTQNPSEDSGLCTRVSSLSPQSSVLNPSRRRWASKIGRVLWAAYWATSVALAAAACLMDAIAVAGWTP